MSSKAIRSIFLEPRLSGAGPALGAGNMMKVYEGTRLDDQVNATVDGRPLDPRFDVWVHSFDGFEWGCCGAGSAQLALALLADHLGDAKQASALGRVFELGVIANLPEEGWRLSSRQIQDVLGVLQVGAVGRVDCSMSKAG